MPEQPNSPAQAPTSETVSADSASTAAPRTTAASSTSRLVSASAVMAAGTALSRVLGFVRLMLLVFLFGNGTRQAEMFTLANTVPNSMYILLAGGVLNTVLVPQIVRAIKGDRDGGDAFTNRIMTAGLIGLAIITTALTAAVPLIISLYSAEGWKDPDLSAQYASMVMLGYYCMPQVFFYGVHVLAGQVLNARDRFGPMMWAPIANNVVSIGVLLLFLGVFGHTQNDQPFTSGQELLLGLGSTLGIAVQAAVLVPFLRASGFRFRPRFDFRHTGLGKTFRLARWTLGFVLVTQLALVVVSKLASGATVDGAGAGLTAYSNAYAVWILPHSLITVSLATAMLPAASRFAASEDYVGVTAETTHAIRLAVTALLPAAVAFFVLGVPMAHLAFGFGAGARDASYVGSALMALAVGLVPFTIQYLLLRAFYALEDTRTTFFLQCLIAATNVVLGVATVRLLDDPGLVATALGGAYSGAYLIGVIVSFRRLRKRLPELSSESLVQHCIRLLAAVTPAALAGWLVCWAITADSSSQLMLALALAVAGLIAVGLFLVMARVLRIAEVGEIVSAVLRRGGGSSGHGGPGADGHPPDGHPTPGDGDGADTAADDLPTTGDSGPRNGDRSLTIEASSAATGPDQGHSGPQESADSMAQAIVVRGLDDEYSDHPVDAAPARPLATAATLPAGTVLGSRYRLEELIAESRPTVTWRAFDQVLSRSVLVHLLAPGDPAENDLLAVARRASVATDSRFVRVLDAVQSTDDRLGSYIVCEYATGQSLDVILSHGPLSALEAAWVVREVADALAGVHGLGLYHRRISPQTVIITPTGNVKIVGLLLEAALRPNQSPLVPGASTPELVDVTDLGRLLYATLVSRWPGGPAFGLPEAPSIGRGWMTPRQVRAGVSPALDGVCDYVLGDPPRHRAAPITTAAGLVAALSKVLGSADASGDLERRLHQPIPVLHRRVDPATGAPPVSSLLDANGSPDVGTRRTMAASTAPAAQVRRPVPVVRNSSGQPTAIRPRTSPSGRVATQPVRRTTRRQPRRWIGILVGLVVLLIVGGVLSAAVLDRRFSAAPDGSASAPSTAPTGGTEKPKQLRIVAGRDFDPQGDDQTENPREVPLAFDGNPKTRWRTVRYVGSPKLGNIKRGVGLVLDLGSAKAVNSVTVKLSGKGTDVELRIPASDPAEVTEPSMSTDKAWRKIAAKDGAGSSATLTPKTPATTRFVLVYLTSLPKEGKGYRGGIYEVAVTQ